MVDKVVQLVKLKEDLEGSSFLAHGTFMCLRFRRVLSLLAQGGDHGIRVNAVNPGIVATPLWEGVSEEAMKQMCSATQLFERPATPEEVGDSRLVSHGNGRAGFRLVPLLSLLARARLCVSGGLHLSRLTATPGCIEVSVQTSLIGIHL